MSARRAVPFLLFALPFLLWAGVAFAVENDPAGELGITRVDERAPVQVRRYALVVGVNDGGPARVRLRYAGTDAEALGRVLTQIGGVQSDDAVVLLDVDREGLSEGLDRIAVQLERATDDVRTELFFYYSGHSDEQGLLLGGERVSYADLREALDALPADVRIAILDSCASGAFTRLKGGARRTPFLVDDSAHVTGHAFLTSSSEDEASQESDRLGGSFFTYALISGLRGAADHTGDGRVSLNEVYQFAFHETLRRTESTLGGPQHPAYDIKLAGSGDLVLTDLRDVAATLALADQIDGRVSIRNSQDRLELELRKFAGRSVTLGLENGGYTVVWDDGVRVREAVIWLGDGSELELQARDFTERLVEHTVERGGAGVRQNEQISGSKVHTAPASAPSGPSASRDLRLRTVPFNVSIVPPLDINTWVRGPDLNHVSLFALGGRSDAVRGVSWGFGFGWVGDMRGVQGAVANWATRLDGVQVGLVNMSPEARGAQVGVVNIAGSMNGVMVGFVNIADDAKVAIGLLNFIKKGIFDVDVYVSDTDLVNVDVKFGARHTYTRIGGGVSPVGDPHVSVNLGLGMRLPNLGPWMLDLDAGSGLVFGLTGWKTPSFRHQVRAIVNWRVAKNFGVFVGPTLNLLVGPSGRDPVTGRADANSQVWEMRDNGSGISVMPVATGDLDNVRLQVWPGGILGLSF